MTVFFRGNWMVRTFHKVIVFLLVLSLSVIKRLYSSVFSCAQLFPFNTDFFVGASFSFEIVS